jgi:hypothetical protein
MYQIHTIGCSFTKWIYPTWADYIQKHYNVKLNNLGYSASGNSIIKKKLYTIDESDHVFVMFSGHNRQIQGIDEAYIRDNIHNNETKTNLLNDIRSDTRSWFRNLAPMSAFINSESVTKHKRSKFNDYYQMLEDIYDCQNYLQAKGIDYNFSMWQGFYNDLSEIRGLNQPTVDDSKYMQNPIYQKIFNSIEQSKFLQNIKQGLWEHMVNSKELVAVQSEIDLHPSTLCHFDYFKTYIKPILDQKIPNKNNIDQLYSQAKDFSEYYLEHTDKGSIDEYNDQTRAKYFEMFEK